MGMHQHTGRVIGGVEDLQQRIGRLLNTRKGKLPLRRGYGSNLPHLIDRKVDESYRIELFMETANALADPENELVEELKLDKTYMDYSDGKVSVSIDAEMLVNGKTITLIGIVI